MRSGSPCWQTLLLASQDVVQAIGGPIMTSEYNVHQNRTSGIHPALEHSTALLYGIYWCLKCILSIWVCRYLLQTQMRCRQSLSVTATSRGTNVSYFLRIHFFFLIEKCFTSSVIDFNGIYVLSFLHYYAVLVSNALDGGLIHLLISTSSSKVLHRFRRNLEFEWPFKAPNLHHLWK